MLPTPPSSPLFPYTTLFRSGVRVPLSDSVQSDSAGTGAVLARVPADSDRQASRETEAGRAGVAGIIAEYLLKIARSTSRRSDRKSTRLNSSHSSISYAVFCL